MRRFYQVHVALCLGLVAVLSTGCGQRSSDSRQAGDQRPTIQLAGPTLTAPSEPSPSAVPDATESTPQAEPAPTAAPDAPPIASDPLLPLPPVQFEPAAAPSGLCVAIGGRTIIGQDCPQEVQDQWRERIRPLVAQDAPFQLVDDPAQADWLIQVAAIERPDVLYLAPGKKIVEKTDDDYLRMSPPGDSAVEWLKIEFENLPQTTELVKLLIANEAAATEAEAKEAQAAPEPLFAQPSGSGPAVAGNSEPSGGSAPSAILEKSMTRAFFFSREGPAEDLRAAIVQEQSGIYHTANRTQALLGTYGKLIPGNKFFGKPSRYEQRTVMQEIDSVRRFTTVERQGQGTGSDFLSFVGSTRQAWQLIDLAGQVAGGRTNEISFEIVGLRLDQNDAIKALNRDPEALNYFDYVQRNGEKPCLILENIVFTSYAATHGTSLNLGGNAKTVLTGDGGGAEFETERSTSNQFSSPIVRGYQMYQVKLNRGQVVDLVYVDP